MHGSGEETDGWKEQKTTGHSFRGVMISCACAASVAQRGKNEPRFFHGCFSCGDAGKGHGKRMDGVQASCPNGSCACAGRFSGDFSASHSPESNHASIDAFFEKAHRVFARGMLGTWCAGRWQRRQPSVRSRPADPSRCSSKKDGVCCEACRALAVKNIFLTMRGQKLSRQKSSTVFFLVEAS